MRYVVEGHQASHDTRENRQEEQMELKVCSRGRLTLARKV